MSMYNLMNGMSPYALFALPMLFDQHPDTLPRFRDCFPKDPNKPELTSHIFVFTRVGSMNQNNGYGEEMYTQHENFVEVYDALDSSYGMYVFEVPEKWKADNELVKKQEFIACSEEYKQKVITRFPKLHVMLATIFYGPEPEDDREPNEKTGE